VKERTRRQQETEKLATETKTMKPFNEECERMPANNGNNLNLEKVNPVNEKQM
jgi:hypothetical protein